MTATSLSREALAKAQSMGLSKADVLHAVSESAPYTHAHFNRRFERLLLKVARGTVLDLYEGPHRAPDPPPPLAPEARELLTSARDAIRDLLPVDPADDPDAGDNARYVLGEIEKVLDRAR